jgi:hypothetical protein
VAAAHQGVVTVAAPTAPGAILRSQRTLGQAFAAVAAVCLLVFGKPSTERIS